ncbi:MAG: radical SAM protein [Planctomycetota bacterium]
MIAPRHWGRLAGLGWDIARSNVPGRRFAPYRITLILNGRCNCRCTMCDIWQKKPAAEMTFHEIDRFFERNRRFSWINLSGGEIFLRPDLEEILALILERCRRLFLLDFPTTGQTPERIESIVAATLKKRRPPRWYVTVSLDGPPEVHDRVRGREGAFERAVETYRRLWKLRDAGFRPFFGYTLQAANEGRLEEALAALRRAVPGLTADDLHVNYAHVSPHYYGNDASALPHAERALGELEAVTEQRTGHWHPVAYLERRYQKLLRRYLDSGRTPLPCAALTASCFISDDWTVHPCSIDGRVLGNLRDHDFDLETLWRSRDDLQELRDGIRRGECPNCWTPCEAYQTILGSLARRSTG